MKYLLLKHFYKKDLVMEATLGMKATFKDYSAIKNLITTYWDIKDRDKYDEFIRELLTLLQL